MKKASSIQGHVGDGGPSELGRYPTPSTEAHPKYIEAWPDCPAIPENKNLKHYNSKP